MKSLTGFTLIETILTIVIVGIVASVAAKILLVGIDTYALVTSRSTATGAARVGMDRMTGELTLVGPGDITSVSDSKISFRDADDLQTDFRFVAIPIPALYRGSDLLASQTGLLDFDYYALDGSSTGTPSDVRRINIELTIDTLGGYGPAALRTTVFPRGFMYSDYR